MKKMGKSILFVTMLLLGHYSQAATITWDSINNSVNENDIFTLDIIGTDFAAGVDVDGGGVDLLFDPTVLNVLSVSIDSIVWDFAVDTGTINNIAGSVSGISVSTLASVTDNFTIASVEFQVVGSAGLNSSLLLSEYVLNQWSSDGSLINPTFVSGNATVSAVPVPAAVWLFGSGLLGLIAVARKKARV